MRKRKIALGIFIVIVLSIFALVGFFRRNYVLPIIMYHSVDPNASPSDKVTVTLDTFERQMSFLKRHRYNVIPLEEAAALIRDKKKIPPKTIAITFDDGYKNNYIYAFPVLKKYRLPATIFIITNKISEAPKYYMSWDEIKEVQASGLITIGSHTLTHPLLPFVSDDGELRKEVFNSKKILEVKLGRPVNMFAYPAGRFDQRVRQAVISAGYTIAVATNPGKKFSSDDIFALKRLRISENCRNLFIFWAETNGFYNYMREHRRK